MPNRKARSINQRIKNPKIYQSAVEMMQNNVGNFKNQNFNHEQNNANNQGQSNFTFNRLQYQSNNSEF